MKIAYFLGFLLSSTMSPHARAAATSLASHAEKAIANLPRGCIVTAERTGEQPAVFSVAGPQESAAVPPEKVIFEIGSISKVFTGILLAQAVIEKRVSLDSTLRDLLGKEHAFADAHVAAITLRQLATHTSGLPRLPENLATDGDPTDPYAHYDRARLNAYLHQVKLAHAPPFASEYSNLGVGLLGDLLARLYGQSWEDLATERIARPLGMTDTRVTLTPEQMKRVAPPYSGDQPAKPWHFQALAGAGALHSTAADMLKFCEALRKPAATSIREAIEMIEQPHGDGIGLCLQVLLREGAPSFWFAGGTGGYRSWIFVKPSADRVVVILINNDALSPESVLTGKAAAGEESNPPATPPDPALLAYAGQYDTGVKAGETRIYYLFEARGSELWMQITGQPFIPLTRHAAAKDRFEFKPVKAELQFTRENGEVVATTLVQEGMEIHARKLSGEDKTH